MSLECANVSIYEEACYGPSRGHRWVVPTPLRTAQHVSVRKLTKNEVNVGSCHVPPLRVDFLVESNHVHSKHRNNLNVVGLMLPGGKKDDIIKFWSARTSVLNGGGWGILLRMDVISAGGVLYQSFTG